MGSDMILVLWFNIVVMILNEVIEYLKSGLFELMCVLWNL